jgi:hypothetical protein
MRLPYAFARHKKTTTHKLESSIINLSLFELFVHLCGIIQPHIQNPA